MPMTVITLKKAPASLRGDLSKWMQEIATGVYIGNFNSRVREQLWARVEENLGVGEASIAYAARNEIGYDFNTVNSENSVIDCDGIPLVIHGAKNITEDIKVREGFSNISKYRKAKKFRAKLQLPIKVTDPYIVLDIETTGLDFKKDKIIEVAALKLNEEGIKEYNELVNINDNIPIEIIKLTGITKEMLDSKGKSLKEVLTDLHHFINGYPIVGYGVDFDMRFLNKHFQENGLEVIKAKSYDLMRFVKREKEFLPNYKLQTVLAAYDINDEVEHRALSDVRQIYQLSLKVKGFQIISKQKQGG